MRGVRAQPGGPVVLGELVDGWFTVTDFSAGGRRVQWVIGIAALALVPVAVVLAKLGYATAESLVAASIFVLVLLLAMAGMFTDNRTAVRRSRLRQDSMLRAGGRQALQSSLRLHGRARTVGQMNILMGSIGRTDPVFSTRRIVSATVERRWWRTVVRLRLTGDHALSYRVIGPFAPARLARVFAAGS